MVVGVRAEERVVRVVARQPGPDPVLFLVEALDSLRQVLRAVVSDLCPREHELGGAIGLVLGQALGAGVLLAVLLPGRQDQGDTGGHAGGKGLVRIDVIRG